MVRTTLYSLFITLACLVGVSFAHAQVTADDIGVDVSPEQPSAYTNVTVKLSSYSINIGTAQISWTLNGKVVLAGVGKTTYQFTTREIGSEDTLIASITPFGGFPIEKKIVIHPMGMDLLWQAVDSIVPPLYRGKALPATDAKIKVVAMPEIRSSKTQVYGQNELMYTWKQNYSLTGDGSSGYGKSAFTFDSSYLDDGEHIDVDANTRDGRLGATAGIDVGTQNPTILWYALSPLYGPLFEKALVNGYEVTGTEQTLLAEPYFFSSQGTNNQALVYNWTINGDSADTQSIPNVLSLHRDTDSSGEALIALSMRNAKKLFQTAKASLTLSLK